jgi:hypothetical protein
MNSGLIVSEAFLSSRNEQKALPLQSSCESGLRAGYDDYKGRNGSKVHVAVGHLMALTVTPASEQERAQVDALCQQVQQATGHTVKLSLLDEYSPLLAG